uniref:Meiosis initiator n=1 Tax=Sus scrofa TaxID=9823 RepID=A0A287BP14_PIG
KLGLGTSDAKFHFGCPNQNQLLSPNRKQRKNHTSKLQELALLLPMALKTGTKKLTKKEILLHVLNYIQFLQKSIDVAKALLELHTTAGKGGLGGDGLLGPEQRGASPEPPSGDRQAPSPVSPCHSAVPERQTRAQNPRRCLALDKPKKQATPSPDRKGGNVAGTTTLPRCADSRSHPKAASSPSQGDRKGGRSGLTLLEVAENSVHCDGGCLSSAFCAPQPASQLTQGTLTHPKGTARPGSRSDSTSCRQKLVFYDPSEEVDKESPDADPWLPAWSPEGCPHGSPLALGPPQIDNWSLTGHPSEILGLRPSLFSSPGKLLPEQILEDGPEDLTYLDPASSPSACGLQGPEKVGTCPLCQSSFSLDHCYLSLSENSRALSSPSSEATDTDTDSDTDSERRPQEVRETAIRQVPRVRPTLTSLSPTQGAEADREGPPSSSNEDEDGDYTWTPTRRATALPAAGRKARKGRAGRGPVRPKESKKAPCPPQTKKKCVNGFIMFCRMNRKQYIRACPGTASTAATKELAQLWRVMTLQERRPYCIKARRFSRQHNRIVKQDSSSSEDEDWETPKPFYQLLAEKARCSPAPAPPLPPHHV